MIRNLLLTLLGAMTVALTAYAKPLSPEQALWAMENQQGNGALDGFVSLKGAGMKLLLTLSDTKQQPLVYAYSVKSGSKKGIVIASADDQAIPVLGYADNAAEGEFPVQMREMMEYFGEQIAWQRTNSTSAAPFSDWGMMQKDARQFIAPMLKTRWGQNAPYNERCPKVGTRQSVTGCTATAMAQVMAYFHWPLQAKGIGHAVCDGRTYTLDLNKMRFNYGQMTTYYNQNSSGVQKRAVASLMLAAGYGAYMKYSPDGSAAAVSAQVMISNFGYRPSATVIRRSAYSDTAWDAAIYNSMASGSPVIYCGFGPNCGHAFVIDGYQGLGYFHINWGWDGASDGYYRLSALAPRDDSRGRTYNQQQEALINLKPNK